MANTPAAPAYAILRVAKHKSVGTLGSSLQHALRERTTPNADPKRRKLNLDLGPKSSSAGIAAMRGLFEKLECKPRHKTGNNSPVLAVEYFVGMSPSAEIAGDRDKAIAYMRDALLWFQKKHGQGNVFAAQMHFDESTPHMSVFVFPERDGKLNAKSFVGGRALLGQMQTDFAAEVGAKYGLKRGAERSKATHVAIADWYKVVGERDQLRTEVQELQHEVVELKGQVATLNGKIDHLTTLMEAMEPAVRQETEIRIGRRLEDLQATSRSPTSPERATTRSGASLPLKKP